MSIEELNNETKANEIDSFRIFEVKTLYYKFTLDQDWSIRFHFVHRDERKYQYKWILKSHFLKEHIILSKENATEYIEKYKSKPRLILGFVFNKKFKKIEINHRGDLAFYLDKFDVPPPDNSTLY